MDALVLAHLAALQLGQQACPDQYCAADAAALSWACPSYCLAIAAAAGAAAVVELAKNRQKQVGWWRACHCSVDRLASHSLSAV